MLISLVANSQDSVLTIPVVVHVIYNTEEQNISEEQINSQIEALNRDYSASNSDQDQIDPLFIETVGNPNLQFVLAPNGINRIQTETVVFGNQNISRTANGGFDGLDDESYLNIWVGNLVPGVLGFAVTDSESQENTGVVVDYEYFGMNGTALPDYLLGRTTVHEIGHFLGLDHLEGTGGCNVDDGIEDTPNQSTAIINCDLGQEQCDNSIMAQNFLQVNVDECLLFFTQGQVQRMRTTLVNDHLNLITRANEILGVEKELKLISSLNYFNNRLYFNVFKSGTYGVKVIDLIGNKVFTENVFIRENYNQKIVGLTSGIYLVQINNKNQYITQRIYVEE